MYVLGKQLVGMNVLVVNSIMLLLNWMFLINDILGAEITYQLWAAPVYHCLQITYGYSTVLIGTVVANIWDILMLAELK